MHMQVVQRWIQLTGRSEDGMSEDDFDEGEEEGMLTYADVC